MTTPSLGSMPIDLDKLIESRMLLVANSGNGKSWALRRVLEQTVTHVQQLVIDPEGEFASLREKFDYIICAPRGADAVATPQTAAALASALWKAGTSAILDLSELKAHERVLFVKRFLETLINMPREFWHATIVVIDEAHLFCPQTGNAESAQAVIDLATRGRKRGLCLLAATTRIAKVDKDCLAELKNKLIGGMTLDVDVKRAADELGLTPRDAMEKLRALEPGNFFAFGPALSPGVTVTRIGGIVTTHPQAGKGRMVAPPQPSAKVMATLAKIQGLQRDAEEEVKTVAGLSAELTKLRRELTIAQKAQPVQQVGHTDKQVQALVAAERAAGQKEIDKLRQSLVKVRDYAAQACGGEWIGDGGKVVTVDLPKPNGHTFSPLPKPPRFDDRNFGVVAIDARTKPVATNPEATGLRSGAVRILQQLAARLPSGYSRPQVGALTKFSHKGGTFGTYMSDLRRAGFITETGGLIFATQLGVESLGGNMPEQPTSHVEAMALWRKALRSGAFNMLQAIVEAGSDGVDRQRLAELCEMTASGGTFGTYLSDLRRNGLISEQNKLLVANDILFPG